MKNVAVVLSGGAGSRMGTDLPKQYIELAGEPVLVHTLKQLENCRVVEGVVVTASGQWKEQILRWKIQFSLDKLLTVATAGADRQMSIRNGLLAAERYMDRDELSGVIIQDAVRPLASVELLTRLIEELKEAPAVMPALPITDTTYTSRDGRWVDGLLDRSALFAGQAPEAFRFWSYLALYRDTPAEELCAMSGSCQMPYSKGWKVKMIQGEPKNIKITYIQDLKTCNRLLKEQQKMQAIAQEADIMKREAWETVIFGTGNAAKAAYLILDKKVDFFVHGRNKHENACIDGVPIFSLEESKLRLQGKTVILGAVTSATENEMRSLLSDCHIKRILTISELIDASDLSHLGQCDSFDYSEVINAILQEGFLSEYLYHVQVWKNNICRYFIGQVAEILKDYQVQGDKLADIACGYGFWSLFFAKRNFEVLGIDYDADRLNVFCRIAEKHPNMTAIKADIRKMAFIPDNSQDISFCAHTIHIVPDWRNVISEMSRITRSKGIIILLIGRPGHLYLKNLYQDSSIMQWDATQENIIKAAAPDAELIKVIDIYTDEALQFSSEAADAILVFSKR